MVEVFIKRQTFDWSKMKAFPDNEINVTKDLKICFGKDRKHCRKGRKCWLPAFSPFPIMFSESFLPKVVKSWDFMIKG